MIATVQLTAQSMNMGVDDIGPIALNVGVGVIIVALVALILGGFMGASYNSVAVTDESHQPSSLPTNLTVDAASNSDFNGVESNSETVVFYDGSSSTNETLVKGDNYTVTSYSDGTFEVQDNFGYNSSEDTLYVSYDWQEDSTASGIVDTGVQAVSSFADWFDIIVTVAAAAIILGLIIGFAGFVMGRRGRSNGAGV